MAAETHWQWTPDGFAPVAVLPLTDRGFRYGMAVFETLRVQDGTAWFVAEHLESLARACFDLDLPVEAAAVECAARFLRQAAWPSATGVVRVHVTAGDGGPGDPVRACRVFVAFEPRERPRAEIFTAGYRLRRHPQAFMPACGGRKTHNYWANIAAYQGARAVGFDEALLFDASDRLISACLGNVFVRLPERPGEWVTPPVACGARAGVIRRWLLKHAAVSEAVMTGVEVQRASAVYIANSWLGVVSNSVSTAVSVREDLHCRTRGLAWDL